MLVAKKAIVLISFGAKDQETRTVYIDSLTAKVKSRFCEYDVFHVFTSRFIIENLRQNNIKIFSLSEILAKLEQSGYQEVLLQPTHISEGTEYSDKIVKVAIAYKDSFSKLIIGKPAIVLGENEVAVLNVLAKQASPLKLGEEAVFMGHGSPSKHNPIYERLQCIADGLYDNITIGVLEENDYPDFSMVLNRLQKKGCQSVCLQPLLFTAGYHVMEDLAGTSNSWQSRLEAAGFSVRVHKAGLGANPNFQEIYLQRLKTMKNDIL